MKIKFTALVAILAAVVMNVFSQNAYKADRGWIVGQNVPRYNNRPIYLHNSNAFILVGDKPLIRFAKQNNLYGTLFLTYTHDGKTMPTTDFDNIKSCYRAGRMMWVMKDRVNPKLTLTMELVPMADSLGGVLKVTTEGMAHGDQISWQYGGKQKTRQYLSWAYDVMGNPRLMSWGIDKDFKAEGSGVFAASKVNYLSVMMNSQLGLSVSSSALNAYQKAEQKYNELHSRLVIDTPDESLNVMAHNSLTAVDGTWYPPVFVHGCMQWNNRLPGWRTMFGGIMFGWHNRVYDEAKFYIDSQVKSSDKTGTDADSSHLYTTAAKNSRFYGKGRIMRDQDFYDMQSQMFDQLVEDYRWTNDPKLIALLRPALELHLQWMDECFDPDGDGLYESYLNTWPTDSQWYNGGGTAEETSYAFRGHLAAMDMAIAAGDSALAAHHRHILNNIKFGFSHRLWLNNLGYSGAYREQGGYQRVHTDPWLYSIFLPIDARLTSPRQSMESLYYTEYALQNDTIPGAGRTVWTSNWVPGIWSVRQLWPGDNYHLALSYFNSDLADDGLAVMKGTYTHTGFNHIVPGNLGSIQGGIDFGDCVHPFARALVSGLFGYRPDYPRGEVSIRPSFPVAWNHASLHVPDYGIDYKKDGGRLTLEISLKRAAVMQLHIPVNCNQVKAVKVNGKKVDYACVPTAGSSAVELSTPSMNRARVEISYDKEIPVSQPVDITVRAGHDETVNLEGCSVLSVYDAQHVFSKYSIRGSEIHASIARNSGHHTVIAQVKRGDSEQWRVLHINVQDQEAEQAEAQRDVDASALSQYKWHGIDISGSYNADVRNIFKQKYLSPRPKTVSVRIGSDGYSPWTFPYWHSKVPQIQLDKMPEYQHSDSTITVPQGVNFLWKKAAGNIAFTSLWDNYPDEMTFDLHHASGKVISLLVCGSTNVMQCHIANAEIVISYEDGQTDTVSLIPPVNYWNLCPIVTGATAPGQTGSAYYTDAVNRFCMPRVMPQTVSLGKNCTAMLITRRLRPDVGVASVTLRCLSQEVVVGLMGISMGK